MKKCFTIIYEDVRHEKLLILLLPLTGADVLKQSRFTGYEINIKRNLTLEKLHRQKSLKDYGNLRLME